VLEAPDIIPTIFNIITESTDNLELKRIGMRTLSQFVNTSESLPGGIFNEFIDPLCTMLETEQDGECLFSLLGFFGEVVKTCDDGRNLYRPNLFNMRILFAEQLAFSII
jgi:hypothetical protein